MDELIVFHALEQADIDKIAYLMLSQVADRLQKRGMHLMFGDEVVALMSKEGYDPQYGARPLRRVIQRTVEDALSEEIIAAGWHWEMMCGCMCKTGRSPLKSSQKM